MTPSAFVTPPPFQCSDVRVNYNRLCVTAACCGPTRQATDICHTAYSFFGQEAMESLCWHCCDEPKVLPPAHPDHEVFPRIDCARVDNPHRICKPTSCCNEERNDNIYCNGVYAEYGDMINSICWYCCSEPKEVGPPLDGRRKLRGINGNHTIDVNISPAEQEAMLRILQEPDPEFEVEVDEENDPTETVTADSKLTGIRGNEDNEPSREFLADAMMENRPLTEWDVQPDDENEDDDEYFRELIRKYAPEEYQQRFGNGVGDKAEEPRDEQEEEQPRRRRLLNYDDVEYFPYQWMLKVKTEYYFRYEGTLTVPPCFNKVHWRVMKDPILVHPRQIREIERLLAQRIAPLGTTNSCQNDTAGKPREGREGEAADYNRPLQNFHKLHRKVICECQVSTYPCQS